MDPTQSNFLSWISTIQRSMVFLQPWTNLPSRRWFQNKFSSEIPTNIENQWSSKIKSQNLWALSHPIHSSKSTTNLIRITNQTILLRILIRWASSSNTQDSSSNMATRRISIRRTTIRMDHFHLAIQATSITQTSIKDTILKWTTILNTTAMDPIKTTTSKAILTTQLKVKVSWIRAAKVKVKAIRF